MFYRLTQYWKLILANIAVALIYLIFALSAYYLTFRHGVISPVWPQAGIALAALMIFGYGVSPAIFIGSFAANITFLTIAYKQAVTGALFFSCFLSLSSVIEVVLGYYILNKLISKENLFFTLLSVKHFIIGSLVMSFVGSLVGSTFTLLFGQVSLQQFVPYWSTWWVGNLLGILLWTPLIISFLPPYCEKWKTSRFIEFMALFLTVVIIEHLVHGVFHKNALLASMPYLSLPFVLWIAYRFTLRSVMITLAMVSFFTIFTNISRHTYYSPAEINILLLQIQCFIGVAIVSVIIVFAAIHEMRKANDDMIKTHEELEMKVFERTKELQLKLEEKIRSEEVLMKSEKHLRELNTTKDKFFSIIAHDLRNPFNSLLGFGELLVENLRFIKVDEVEGLLRNMNKSIKGVHTLLENLLSWSRIQTGNFRFNPQILDISLIVDENIELLERIYKEKNMIVVNDIPEFTFANADANMVSTIIRNLLSNAIKFSYPGGKIIVSVIDYQTDLWEVQVKDEGVGINDAEKEKLFKSDILESKHGTMDEKGTGLGLKIAREFVEKNGGKIWVVSDKGIGTVFKFTIPKKFVKK